MRLRTIAVTGLFNRFHYQIPINLSDRITIITGLNGSGKTMILRLIFALFSRSYLSLARIPFQQTRLRFDDSTEILVDRELIPPTPEEPEQRPRLRITHLDASKRNTFPSFEPSPSVKPEHLAVPLNSIDDIIPELSQVGPQAWRNNYTGELLSLDQVVERYSDDLPVSPDFRDREAPDWLSAISTAIPVRLINTERLYTQAPRRRRVVPYGYQSSSEPAVRRYSQELGATIKQTLTQYAELSQSLDRTFPTRLVTQFPAADVTMDKLLRELADIEAKRAQLVDAGLLTDEPSFDVRPSLKEITDTQKGVLAVYAQDARRKLGVFDDVFSKIDLFRKTINARFRYQKVTVSQSGFGIITQDGSRLDPTLLSSGEQHELVILYELLFRVRPNSLVLVDEPEISLHAAWQSDFLEDLERVAKVSSFDVLIATHSPQIISDHWDWTVELKDNEGALS